MTKNKKIFILPFFGKLPEWMSKWKKNMENLNYDYIIDTNLEDFKDRVKRVLKIDCFIENGTGKVWDFRPALGLLYEKEIEGYTHWGHTDFDCVYGDVDKFEPKCYDIWSNHHNYIMGAWTIYKNTPLINKLFMIYSDWREKMVGSKPLGWAEKEYTQTIDSICNIKVVYTHNQTKSPDNFDNLKLINKKLYDGEDEIMMAHFRHTKVYPNI